VRSEGTTNGDLRIFIRPDDRVGRGGVRVGGIGSSQNDGWWTTNMRGREIVWCCVRAEGVSCDLPIDQSPG
jgi:hypothetical protein